MHSVHNLDDAGADRCQRDDVRQSTRVSQAGDSSCSTSPPMSRLPLTLVLCGIAISITILVIVTVIVIIVAVFVVIVANISIIITSAIIIATTIAAFMRLAVAAGLPLMQSQTMSCRCCDCVLVPLSQCSVHVCMSHISLVSVLGVRAV